MKKIFGLVGVGVIFLAFSAAACGGKDKPPLTPDSEIDGGGMDPAASPAAPPAPK